MTTNLRLDSSAVEETVAENIASWSDVGVTVDGSGAVGEAGTVQGSRGMGVITDVWEDLMAYGDAPVQIPNSIRRIRLKTTAITSGQVVAEICGS